MRKMRHRRTERPLRRARQRFALSSERSSKSSRSRTIGWPPIAAPTLAAVDAIDGLNDQLMDQEMATHTAEGNYQEAKLSREIAEIEIVEYKLGIAVQELAVAEGELKLAQSELERAKANTAESKMRLGRISRYSNESPSGLNLVYLYTDHLKADELGSSRPSMSSSKPRARRKSSSNTPTPSALKELQADIEKSAPSSWVRMQFGASRS